MKHITVIIGLNHQVCALYVCLCLLNLNTPGIYGRIDPQKNQKRWRHKWRNHFLESDISHPRNKSLKGKAGFEAPGFHTGHRSHNASGPKTVNLIEAQYALLKHMAGKPATPTGCKHDCFYCLQGSSNWWPFQDSPYQFKIICAQTLGSSTALGTYRFCFLETYCSTTEKWYISKSRWMKCQQKSILIFFPTVSAAWIFPSRSFKLDFFAVKRRPEQSIRKENPRCCNSGNLLNCSKYPWTMLGHGFEGILPNLYDLKWYSEIAFN